jgi:hypothetical protein
MTAIIIIIIILYFFEFLSNYFFFFHFFWRFDDTVQTQRYTSKLFLVDGQNYEQRIQERSDASKFKPDS